MEKYILGNKEAWEEAFEMRSEHWGKNIIEKISSERFPFFYKETIDTFAKYHLAGKTIGQFCCNNGRELMSLVHTVQAKEGVGFDIAENMVDFANDTAQELCLPCKFVATNVYEIDKKYKDYFDFILITEGALCWLKDLPGFFQVVSRCMKEGGSIVIEEQHPITNTLALEGEELYDEKHPTNMVYSYFNHEWIGNDGMYYVTGKSYQSKTFTDYTHSMSEIISAMCHNQILITDLAEFEYDVVSGNDKLDHCGVPLSMIIQGKKCGVEM